MLKCLCASLKETDKVLIEQTSKSHKKNKGMPKRLDYGMTWQFQWWMIVMYGSKNIYWILIIEACNYIRQEINLHHFWQYVPLPTVNKSCIADKYHIFIEISVLWTDRQTRQDKNNVDFPVRGNT